MRKNVFFDLALNKAPSLLGKKGRVLSLLVKMTSKLRTVSFKDIQIKEKFFTLGRMVKAYALGHYREIPWKPLLMITAVVIYFVNPIDIIPDWIPGLGLSDDFTILASVYATVKNEIDKFLSWERSRSDDAIAIDEAAPKPPL